MLATGDARGAVSAADVAGIKTAPQLAGDALLLALALGVTGACELASRCAAALRERRWDGDGELARELDAGCGVGERVPLADMVIDLEELAGLLDAGIESSGGRVDLATGEVWPEFVLEEAWSGDDADLEDEDRWLYVPPVGSRPAYVDMVDFTATRGNRELVTQLEIAVEGRGAFRRFKNVLIDWPDDREDWFTFSDERRRGRARAWLADAGYRAIVRTRPRPVAWGERTPD